MTMAEAVGFVLAVVPLLISAAEHYGNTVRAFKKYCQYSNGIKRLVAILNIQRVVFRGAIRTFLSIFVDEETAVEMLEDANHLGWTDAVVSAQFAQRFRDNHEAMSESAKLIETELDKLEKEVANFEQSPTDRPSIKKKIKYALAGDYMERSINQVRALTQDFWTLVDQARAYEERKKPERSSTNKAIDNRFRIVQTAASQLYEALGAACTKHSEHQAHLSLEPAYEKSRPQVRFRIAFRQRASSIIDQSGCSFFTVESSVTGSLVASDSTIPINHLQQALKRTLDNVGKETATKCEPKKLKKKAVRFRSPSPARVLPIQASVVPDPVSLPALVNLCKHSNLCNQLQNFLAHARLGQCIGFLEHCSKSKHLIYLDSREESISRTLNASTPAQGSMTLTNLLSQLGTGSAVVSLSVYERLKLGRQLSQAVLHFNATPWLKTNWSSSDILIYGIDLRTDANRAQSNEPYLNVAVKGPMVPLSRSSTFPTRTLIRNHLVFGLGVMLLELAYQAPLLSLQKATDVDAYEESNTLYYIADRVRHATSRMIGSPRYAEVARKCVQCDFGRGSDLNDASLQDVFFREVVQELENMESELQKFHLDS